jgi:hypothetical protein
LEDLDPAGDITDASDSIDSLPNTFRMQFRQYLIASKDLNA